MSLRFDTRHEQHAIGEFSATMQFDEFVLESDFGPIRERLQTLAVQLDLPAQPQLNVMRFGVVPAGFSPPASPVTYQRIAKDGTAEAVLTCDGATITFSIRNYERWFKIQPDLCNIFVELADAYLPTVGSIKLIKLQYLNEFRAHPGEDPSATEVFKRESKWIAPFAADTDEFWHSHVGTFIPVDGHQRNLVNVNCDVLSADFPDSKEPRRYVKVLILAGVYYDVGEPLRLTGQELRDKLGRDLNAAHALERRTLAEVIADPYLEVMGALNDEY